MSSRHIELHHRYYNESAILDKLGDRYSWDIPHVFLSPLVAVLISFFGSLSPAPPPTRHSFSVLLYLSHSLFFHAAVSQGHVACFPSPNVLEKSPVGRRSWLRVYFHPAVKCLLITVDNFRSVTVTILTQIIHLAHGLFDISA